MKISVIMPTYNDAESLEKTLNSLLNQTYMNYELIIMDDGSTDDTKDVINKFEDKRIKYYYQENADQLNAILNSLDKISGDYVYILHSDDLLPDSDFFSKCVEYMNSHDYDSIIGDLIIINENDDVIGTQKVKKYANTKWILPLQYLWLGRNLFVDVAFYKKSTYLNRVKNNYLMWNTPNYIDFTTDKINLGNVNNVDFSMLKYRVFENNYINNELGKLNVINGEIRTLTNLMAHYCIPFYKFQFYLYRVFNKVTLEKYFRPIYFLKEETKKYHIIKFAVEKRFGKNYKKNIFLNSLISFFKNYHSRSIQINDSFKNIYYGKDMRTFNKNLLNHQLEDIYLWILEEMAKGFDTIIVGDKKTEEEVINMCKFLCIYPFVKIEVRNKK